MASKSKFWNVTDSESDSDSESSSGSEEIGTSLYVYD